MGQIQPAHPVPAHPEAFATPLATQLIEALLTVRQVAGILNVSTATVYGLVERRDLEHTRVSNGIRFTREQVDRYLFRPRHAPFPRR